MESGAVKPPASAVEGAVERSWASAERLSSVLSRTADALEESATLAEVHAERHEQAGRSDDAAEERRVAGRAREGARRARSQAEEWLESAANRKPSGSA
jgi:hypothetical protein